MASFTTQYELTHKEVEYCESLDQDSTADRSFPFLRIWIIQMPNWGLIDERKKMLFLMKFDAIQFAPYDV